MATFYVDFDNGHDTDHDGTAATASPNGTPYPGPWATLDKFTETDRPEGTICIVRGGMTQTVTSDLTFLGDGKPGDPIIIKRDYGDEWGDEGTASQTATLTFGSKTVTFAGDISGDIAAGDWIYETTEDNTEFAYEVASVSGGSNEVVTLYLPYKGAISGAGKTIEVMTDNPIWNTAAGNYQWNFDGDEHWLISGIHLRGTDSNGCAELDSCHWHTFKDCILEGNGASDYGIRQTDDGGNVWVHKCRFIGNSCLVANTGAAAGAWVVHNSLLDPTGNAIQVGTLCLYYMEECEIDGNIGQNSTTAGPGGYLFLRNCNLTSGSLETDEDLYLFWEDYGNTVGDNRQYKNFGHTSSVGVLPLRSETTKVRSGGSNKSIKITPYAEMSGAYGVTPSATSLLIFEIPFYATTDSKTYTVYFACDDNTDWDASPSATELWIELGAWGHAANNFRKITKSSGSVDFTTDTDFDQELTVTVAPAQAGVAYLRCYYTKTLEGGKANIFYADPIPTVA